MSEAPRPWYRELNGYHWFVLIVCTLGWLCDTGNQQLFANARKPAMAALLNVSANDTIVDRYAGYATSIMLIGWATGGIVFGIMGDRIGRAKTMVWTILAFSVSTGLISLSRTPWEFMGFLFLTGLGVGGQFSVGVSLVAEVMPDRARTPALGLLQAFSAAGNVGAAMMAMGLSHLAFLGVISSPWRWMFAIGVVPALLAVLVFTRLREPEKWQQSVGGEKSQKKAGSLADLFGTPRWRKNVILGMLLALSGVIGLWGIGFFSIDLNQSIIRRAAENECRAQGDAEKDRALLCQCLRSPQLLETLEKEKVRPQDLLSLDDANRDPQQLLATVIDLATEKKTVSAEAVLANLDQPTKSRPAQSTEERQRRAAYLAGGSTADIDAKAEITRVQERTSKIRGEVGKWGAWTSMMFNIGAFLGVYAFSRVTQRIGRRPTFAIFFFAAFVSTAIAFLFMNTKAEIFWMVPMMGFCQLSVFGGYAIYFPELFPTHLRSTGTSFCYNIGRFVAASGPLALGLLTSVVYKNYDEPMRYAGLTMCSIFLLGIVVVYFAPETKDKPLPA